MSPTTCSTRGIRQIVGRDRIHDRDALDGPRPAIQSEQRPLLQQLTNEPAPDEAGASGHDDLHVPSSDLEPWNPGTLEPWNLGTDRILSFLIDCRRS